MKQICAIVLITLIGGAIGFFIVGMLVVLFSFQPLNSKGAMQAVMIVSMIAACAGSLIYRSHHKLQNPFKRKSADANEVVRSKWEIDNEIKGRMYRAEVNS